MKWSRLFLAVTLIAVMWPQVAGAQTKPAPAPAPAPEDDPDRDPNRNQPDFTIVNLPTTLRVPRFKSAFRVTHRFGRPLGAGDFGDLANDFFGLDSGAQIGLEYRFGLIRGGQVGIHRTSNKTIELFGQYNVLEERKNGVIGLDAFYSIDGTNNFKDSYTPALGIVVSRELGGYGAIYVEPMWVNNSNPLPSELTDDNDTFTLGIGGRLRKLGRILRRNSEEARNDVEVHKEFELDFVNSAAGDSGSHNIFEEKKREEKSNSPPGLKFGFWLQKVFGAVKGTNALVLLFLR